jgi:hypothetical protein
MPRRPIDRRVLLKGTLGGVSASLALPLLEAMLPARAHAAPNQPKLFGVFYWANGIRKEQWVPATAGTAWELTPELTPLKNVREYVSPVTGMEVKDARFGHHSATVGMLSGTPCIDQSTAPGGANERTTFAAPSIDVVVSKHWESQTRLRSLELTALPNRYDEGTTYEQLSHNGPNSVNPAELSLTKAFDRLFGVKDPQANALAVRRSILDVVKEDAKALKKKVGTADQKRLDEHFEYVNALQRSLQSSAVVCTPPTRPADLTPNGANLSARFKVLTELTALALACDITRVFSLRLTPPADNTPLLGLSSGVHDLTHGEGGNQPQLHRCVVYAMEQFAVLLERLKATVDPTGQNLLDRLALLGTSDCQLGATHDNTDFPILIAGQAKGALKAGVHYRSPNAESSTKVLLTILKALDLPYTEFGTAQMRVTTTIPLLS